MVEITETHHRCDKCRGPIPHGNGCRQAGTLWRGSFLLEKTLLEKGDYCDPCFLGVIARADS